MLLFIMDQCANIMNYYLCFTEFNETYDCPGEILNSQHMASPIPMYYALDEPYPDSITNTFNRGTTNRGRPDGHVYDEPEVDPRRRPYVVVENPRGM